MDIIERLRARGTDKSVVRSSEGDFTGYVLTEYLTPDSGYALVATTPKASPDTAVVISMHAITGVDAAD